MAKNPPITVVSAITSPRNIDEEITAENGTINMNEEALPDPSRIVVIK